MNVDDFNDLRKQAGDLFASQPAKDKNKVTLDSVFIALAVANANPAKKSARDAIRKQGDEPAPEWFTDTLKRLKGTGEKVTVGRFLLLAGQFPATRSDSLNVSRWLREAGYTPRKTGGNLLFEL
jgi:hypothetical protein